MVAAGGGNREREPGAGTGSGNRGGASVGTRVYHRLWRVFPGQPGCGGPVKIYLEYSPRFLVGL